MKIQKLEESKQDIQNFIDKFGQDTYDLFIKSKDRLKNNKLSTDITWHTKNTTPEEMENMLATLQQKVGGNKDLSNTDFSKQQIPGKYNYLGRMGGYDVYEPLDYISSMALGVNTGWCTTGRYGHYGDPNFTPSEENARGHFNEYTGRGIRLIYLLNPKTHYGEIAIAVYPQTLYVEQRIHTKNKLILLEKTNFEIFNAQDYNDYSLLDAVPKSLKENLGLVIEGEQLEDFSNATTINPNEVEDITLLSIEEAEQLPKSILACNNWWWLRSPGTYYSDCATFVDIDGYVKGMGDLVSYGDISVRPSLIIPNLKSSNLKIGDIVKCFNIPWYYIGNDMILSVVPMKTMAFNEDDEKGNKYEGSDVYNYIHNWLKEQMSKNESLKESKKMNIIKEDKDLETSNKESTSDKKEKEYSFEDFLNTTFDIYYGGKKVGSCKGSDFKADSEDDFDEIIEESLTESLSPEEAGASGLFNDLIQREYEQLNQYDSVQITLEDQGDNRFSEILEYIKDDLNIHIGMLQSCLDDITGSGEQVDQGEAQADQVLGEGLQGTEKMTLEESLFNEDYYEKWRDELNAIDSIMQRAGYTKDDYNLDVMDTQDGLLVDMYPLDNLPVKEQSRLSSMFGRSASEVSRLGGKVRRTFPHKIEIDFGKKEEAEHKTYNGWYDEPAVYDYPDELIQKSYDLAYELDPYDFETDFDEWVGQVCELHPDDLIQQTEEYIDGEEDDEEFYQLGKDIIRLAQEFKKNNGME